MLVPHALSRTVSQFRSVSATRLTLECSRVSIVYGMDGRLRGIPVKMALKLGSADLAAGKRHCFENPLVAECWFLILFFRRSRSLVRIFFVRVPVLFSHKQ